MKHNTKIKCDKCNKVMRSRHITQTKNGFLCSNCRRNISTNLGKANTMVTFDEAINRIYEVKGYKNKIYLQGNVCFPAILIGHKFKINLIQ